MQCGELEYGSMKALMSFFPKQQPVVSSENDQLVFFHFMPVRAAEWTSCLVKSASTGESV